jgi:hypothetical protein
MSDLYDEKTGKLPGLSLARSKAGAVWLLERAGIKSASITADAVLTVMRLFNEIEDRKASRKLWLLENPQAYDDESFILYASLYLLYGISE